jgi:uncharacterized protein (TIGR02677 family)
MTETAGGTTQRTSFTRADGSGDDALDETGQVAGAGLGNSLSDDGSDDVVVSEPLPETDRLDLYRYVTNPETRDGYIALMRLFTNSLLTDLSASEAHAALEKSGYQDLSVTDVEARCKQLEQWGNLIRSVRDARVSTISEYLRSKARYQVSKFGGRVHRQIDELLAAQDGAREVARELLGGTAETLKRIAEAAERLAAGGEESAGVSVDALAADVTAVFNNQRLFADSATDFYAFVQGRMARYDLSTQEFSVFKTMLLDYVELISADVNRHAPLMGTYLVRITMNQPTLLAALASLPSPVAADGVGERSPGREADDWEALSEWYLGRRGRSGPDQLRAAADQALGQVLTNAKRMLSAAGAGVSRRADFLRLATWFDNADTPTAHRIYDAAFGAYPSRHLLFGPQEDDGRAGPTTSWWEGEPVDVPLSLRERGDRTARGRSSKVPDPGLDRERLLAEAEEEERRNRAAAAELIAVGDLNGARVSPAARNLLLDQLAQLLAREQDLAEIAEYTDTDLGLRIVAAPDEVAATVVHSDDGDTTVHGVALTAGPVETSGTVIPLRTEYTA